MALSMEQAMRIQVEIMNGQTWETRTAAVPDTDEARETWDTLAAEIAEITANGGTVDIPHELPI